VNWLAQTFRFSQFAATLTGFHTQIHDPEFWLALFKIMWINVLLSGDNALVIAMACRGLQPRQRFWGMILGAGVAVFLLVIFTGIVAALLGLPYLKLAGGLALIVIAAKLLVPEDDDEDTVQAASHLWAAVRIVAVADVIMSLDNVIAVAAAANGNMLLLVASLAISIPIIVAGAALIMTLLDRLPFLVWAGAALLGWIAGDVIATDPGVAPLLHRLLDGQIALVVDLHQSVASAATQWQANSDIMELACSVLGVIVVLTLGSYLRSRKMSEQREASVAEAA
jgi:YjbE family integral membrane protein